MLQTLQNDLNTLQTKIKQQDQKLENLYISFQEIYDLQNSLENPSSTKHNMLHQVRPEVFHQILIFLDIKQILRFRVLSRRANEVAKMMIPNQIVNLKQLIADEQKEIQLNIQDLEEIAKDPKEQQSLAATQDELSRINKSDINMLRSLHRPPELVEKIINLVCMTLDPNFKIQKDNWKECQKFISRPNFLELIMTFEIGCLSDKQLQQLEQVNNYSEQQAAQISICACSLLNYLKAVLQIRQSKLYIKQNKIRQLETKVKQEEQLIQKLEKIMK